MLIDIKEDKSERVKYDYPDFLIYVRFGVLSDYPNFAADSHWHDDIELIAVLSGQMLYNVNGEIITMNEGEGILVNARQFHYGYSKTMEECEFICILFHPILLCTSRMFENEFVEPVLSGGMSYLHLSPEVKWQNAVLQHICEIYHKRNEKTAPLYAQGLICLLWNEILANTECIGENRRHSESRLVTLKRMIAYIHENYTEKITLADIADAGNISKRTCGNIFMEYQNKTPVEFLVDYRLRKSIELMKNTDMTILEISLATGFSGASYYAETFRKYFGKSPAEYRKQLPDG